ncbi:hypothetical protein ACCT18_01330 [Rhizobium ruizarguesonis]
MSYRLPMPLVHVDQAFSTAAELEAVLASLHTRALWFLSTRSNVEVNEEYKELGVYLWTVKGDDEYVAHVELADRRHALANYPGEALWMPFEGTWTLRAVEAAMKTDTWRNATIAVGIDHFRSRIKEAQTDE